MNSYSNRGNERNLIYSTHSEEPCEKATGRLMMDVSINGIDFSEYETLPVVNLAN